MGGRVRVVTKGRGTDRVLQVLTSTLLIGPDPFFTGGLRAGHEVYLRQQCQARRRAPVQGLRKVMMPLL